MPADIKTNWKGSGIFGRIAAAINRLGLWVNNFEPQYPLQAVENAHGGIDLSLAPGAYRQFPGVVILNGQRWYDADLQTVDTEGRLIADNSDGAKTYVKVDKVNDLVSYESTRTYGVAGVEYYKVADNASEIHVTGFV